MPLEAPKLDNRTYEEIRNLIRSRIPQYTPEWTDFNESDPGMTLVDLFAWLSEMMLYQMNQVPERNYLKFLKMLNMELRPPVPATAHLTFTPQANATTQPIPVRSQVAAQSPETGELVIFETDKGIDLVPYALEQVQVYDGAAFSVVTEANASQGNGYSPLGWNPQLGSALYLGFLTPDPVAPETTPPIGQFPQQFQMRIFLPVATQAGKPQNAADVVNPPVSPVSLVWEYRHPGKPDRWQPLTVYNDETVGFNREGYIALQGPQSILATIEGKLQDKPRYWIRCRLESGVYPAGQTPQIDFIAPNTVSALSLVTVRNEIVGTSEGHPGQSFELRNKPVHQDSLELRIDVPDSPLEDWTMVEDLFASGPNDRYFTLNATAGTIQFGDGEHGQIPVAGAEITAMSYRYGGGKDSNVAANAINIPLTTLVGVEQVTNQRASMGGNDEQDIEELKVQAPSILRHRNRAVTKEDYAALALQAGGVRKATALPLAHPDHPDFEVPGTVTVVIVPDTQDRRPEPSSELIRHVCNYLDDYRLLTTELFVKGPGYLEITVEVLISAKPYVAFGKVEEAVRQAVNQRLDPFEWTFGRDFYPTGLYRDILRVTDDLGEEMVSAVPYLSIFVDGIPHEDLREPVQLKPDQLVYGGDHKITVTLEQDS